MTEKSTFNLPSLQRIGKRTGITRCGAGFEQSLEKFIVEKTKQIVDKLVVLCIYQDIRTATPEQLRTVLKCMGVDIAIPARTSVTSLKPFNSRKKATGGAAAQDKPKKKVTKNKRAIQESYLDRLMIPMKNFDGFCRGIIKTFINSKKTEVTLRYESPTIPLIQFCVERLAQKICFDAMNLAQYSKRDTVYGRDIDTAIKFSQAGI